MSLSSLYSTLNTSLFEHQAIAMRGLEQCRRRGFATLDLISEGHDYTERDWRVSVPGSGYGSGGGLGTRDPTDVPSIPGQSANDPRRNGDG